MISSKTNPENTRVVEHPWLKSIALISSFTMLVPLLATKFISGKSSAEKMVTSMAQPLFLSIVGALVLSLVLLKRGERAIGALMMIGAVSLWLLSSPILVKQIFAYWESKVVSADTDSMPLDTLVVLGGGTTIAPDGRPQFGDSGDRVGYAATLFLTGKTKRLVTTGDVLELTGSLAGRFEAKDDPSVQTKQIWADLGIPSNVISELPGQNTYSEIAALKEHPEWWQGKRCGLLTSAFHMPRAMSLAKNAGVQVLPINADYRTNSSPFVIKDLIPDAGELFRLQSIIKEWIAMRIGR
jgi:uncharacterized SAM-binding protein YcdF (DUF218 family)